MHSHSAFHFNLSRGHETAAHQEMKRLIARLYLLLNWFIVFEEHLCDVVAWKCCRDGRMRIVGIEAERSARHVVANATKDLALGCDRVLLVVPDETLRAAVRRKLQRDLPITQKAKVGITTISRIEAVITRLENK